MRAGTRILHKDVNTQRGSESVRCRLSHLMARTRSGLKADSSLILMFRRVRALCSRPFCADSKAVSFISLQTILTEPAAKEDPNYASHKHRHEFPLTFAVLLPPR